jgi:predicted PolB exonuclease-like 3'-5' exonuclease
MNDNALIVDIEAVGIDRAADYLEPVEAPDNYKKPEAIEKYIAEATAKAIDRCGLDPDLCRIVALGYGGTTCGDGVTICKNEDAEARALEYFWRTVVLQGDIRPIVSFNGFGYDLPVLMRRSQYLGIAHPFISLDRYRSPHIDLMQKLTWDGRIKAHKLSFYASRFGWPVVDTVDGSQVAALVKAGDWKAVESHCLNDLAQTRFIAQKLKLIPSTQTVAQVAGAAF